MASPAPCIEEETELRDQDHISRRSSIKAKFIIAAILTVGTVATFGLQPWKATTPSVHARNPLFDDVIAALPDSMSLAHISQVNSTLPDTCASGLSSDLISAVPIRPFSVGEGGQSMAPKLFELFFSTILGSPATDIMAELAEELTKAILDEMGDDDCADHPRVPGGFCAWQSHRVAKDFGDSLLANSRDGMARSAYGRLCGDVGGRMLIQKEATGSSLCRVISSMTVCFQALPPCSQELYVTKCLDLCRLNVKCAQLKGSSAPNGWQNKCYADCQVPVASQDPWYQFWLFSRWQHWFVVMILIVVSCFAFAICKQ